MAYYLYYSYCSFSNEHLNLPHTLACVCTHRSLSIPLSVSETPYLTSASVFLETGSLLSYKVAPTFLNICQFSVPVFYADELKFPALYLLPICYCNSDFPKENFSGILMHLSSLP